MILVSQESLACGVLCGEVFSHFQLAELAFPFLSEFCTPFTVGDF